MNLDKARPRALRVGSIASLLALLTFVVYRTASPPLWKVTARDAQAAARDVEAPRGGDERVTLVDADLVGGEGVIEPADRESKVSAAVSGRVGAVNVREGDHVKAGDVLVTLDAAVEHAALDAAEREVAVQRAQLRRTAAGQRPEEVEAAIADAESARARAAQSSDTLARTERLAQAGTAAPEELEKARHQAAIDERELEASEARKRQAIDGARRDDVAIEAAKLQADIARAEQARAQYDNTLVRAPIDGEILQVKFRAGEYFNVLAAEPLVVMGDARTLRVRMDVNERDIARIRVGQASFAVLPAFGSKRFPGRVVEIGRRMGRKNVRSDDPTERIDTKILEVVCELATSDGLVPGLRVTNFIDPANGS